MNWARYGYFWCLDYLYAVARQIDGIRGGDPARYAGPGKDDAIPVVIVPGVYERWRFMEPLIQAVHRRGHPVFAVESLGRNLEDVPSAAQALARRIEELGFDKVALLAHSKGGLIGKYAMSFCDAGAKIERMVAVSAPFSGSALARFMPLPALRAFAPGDQILTGLLRDTRANSRIVSIYGEFDPHIPGGSRLQGARNVRLPVVGHFRILSDPAAVTSILNELSGPARSGAAPEASYAPAER